MIKTSSPERLNLLSYSAETEDSITESGSFMFHCNGDKVIFFLHVCVRARAVMACWAQGWFGIAVACAAVATAPARGSREVS